MSDTNSKMISVIIPAYNAGKYLDSCLASVIRQENCVFEIIVIDDGSIDNTGTICKKYMREYDNLHYVYQENRGQGTARERGIQMAQGEWLVFLDADDEMLPNALEKLGCYANSDAEIVWYEYGIVSESQADVVFVKVSHKLNDKRKMMKRTTTFLWDKMFRKSFWEKQDIRMCNLYGEDIMPVYVLFAQASEVRVLHEPLVLHYVRTDNLSSDMDKLYGITDSIRITIEEFCRRGLYEEYKSELLAMLRNQYQWYDFEHYLGKVSQRITKQLELLSEEYFHEEANPMREQQNRLLTRLECMSELIIYGAGKVGSWILNRMRTNENVLCVAVTDNKKTEGKFAGKPIVSIDCLQKHNHTAHVVVAVVNEEYRDQMVKRLRELAFCNIITVPEGLFDYENRVSQMPKWE